MTITGVALRPSTLQVIQPRTNMLMETKLYDAGNDKPIWSAASETEIQGSKQGQIQSYIGVMVDSMADQKLLR